MHPITEQVKARTAVALLGAELLRGLIWIVVGESESSSSSSFSSISCAGKLDPMTVDPKVVAKEEMAQLDAIEDVVELTEPALGRPS